MRHTAHKFVWGVMLYIALTMPAFSADTSGAYFYTNWELFLKMCITPSGTLDRDAVEIYGMYLTFFLRDIAALSHAEYEQWPRAEKLAFWINVYNAWAVRLVCLNPTRSNGQCLDSQQTLTELRKRIPIPVVDLGPKTM